MADTKISALTALVAGDIQHTSDVVAIVDTSVTTTKKATAQAVVNAVLAQNTDTTVTGTINQTTIPTSKTLLVSTDVGSTVQGYDAQLADVAGLAVTDGNFIVGNGTNFVAESGSTARTSLGLGTGDSPEFTAVNIGSATDTTVTRVSAGVIAVEGSNVLLASNIGTSVQAYDAQLADVAGLAVTDGNFIVGNGANFVAESGATARTSLGLGTGDSPEFTAVNIGSATDTTITRSSAGVIAVEGSNVLMASNIGSTVQAYDADTAKTDVAQTFTAAQTFGADVTLNAQSDLRFADSDSSNWVAFQSPATVASNVTWTLPAADGTSNQVLATNGSGTLSWATAGGGASISAGDSKVEVTDTGSNGTIVFNTDGSERMRIDSSGRVGIGTNSPSYNLAVAGSGSVISSVVSSSAGAAVRISAGGGFDNRIDFTTTLALKDETGGVNRMYIDTNGSATFRNNISIGNATPTTSGSGITFPATQSASSDVNTLDDYEEGDWTPTYTSTGASFSYTGQTGRYIKIGNMVWISFQLATSSASGTITNDLYVTSLPFTPANTASNYSSICGPTSNFTNLPTGITQGSSGIYLYQSGTITALTPTTSGINAAAKYLWGSMVYSV
jgi:hypothetical protein